jgi:hypothetical protein
MRHHHRLDKLKQRPQGFSTPWCTSKDRLRQGQLLLQTIETQRAVEFCKPAQACQQSLCQLHIKDEPRHSATLCCSRWLQKVLAKTLITAYKAQMKHAKSVSKPAACKQLYWVDLCRS